MVSYLRGKREKRMSNDAIIGRLYDTANINLVLIVMMVWMSASVAAVPIHAHAHKLLHIAFVDQKVHPSSKHHVRRSHNKPITYLFANQQDEKGKEEQNMNIVSNKNIAKKSNNNGKGRIKNNAKKGIKPKTKIRKQLSKRKDAEQSNIVEQSNKNFYIQFSRVFQRHVVYKYQDMDKDEVIKSFEFLDDAIQSFPNCAVLAPMDLPFPPPSCSLVYPDDDNKSGNSLISRGRAIDTNVEEEECETTVAGMGLWTLCELEYIDTSNNLKSDVDTEEASAALRKLLELVSVDNMNMIPRHFFRLDTRRIAMRGLTSESIMLNYAQIVNLLSCKRGEDDEDVSSAVKNVGLDGTQTTGNDVVGLAMSPTDVDFVMQNFPQLCLYKCEELEMLIRFLLQPLPDVSSIPSVAMVADRGDGAVVNIDWPSLSGKGYGAGLTVDQATKAIKIMPELLALYYEDSRKPSINYLNHMNLPVPAELIIEANNQLDLEGADPADDYLFAYLNYIGIEWSQLRILQSSLPLWTTNNVEPGWELYGSRGIRSKLKRPALDFLRQRLQIRPSDIFKLLKTHSRLSTYDSCNKIMPTCDMLQSRLHLTSAELRKVILRMPSIVGIGTSAFNDRLEFFTHEVDMSLNDFKEAVLKQPSLLQYGINSTLRPKLDFFVKELGMEESSVSRLVKLAPAVIGLSLADNLRPKVASIMKLCDLSPYEIGYIVSTSPQELLLSHKKKIEPTLRYLRTALMLTKPRELGEIVLKAPRVLRQGIESSLARKIEMLTNSNVQKSRSIAISIIRNNPSLLTSSNGVLEGRIERCPIDKDLAILLQPSTKGRFRIIQQSQTKLQGDPILASSSPEASLDTSLTKIYQSMIHAAQDLGITEYAVLQARETGTSINGQYLHSIANCQMTLSNELQKEKQHAKTIPISIFCSGGVYPSDRDDVARGQSRTGGLSIQVFTDGSVHDKTEFLQEFSTATKVCFGIHVPTGGKDNSKLVSVFPGVNPSSNRCEIFACSGSLRILETFLNSKGSDGDVFYDIKIYTDSSYVWKLVKSKEKLLELGSYFTSQEMLQKLDMPDYSVNIDILHPLARCFSRLNGRAEPSQSTRQPLDNVNVEFRHSMDDVPLDNGGLTYVRRLKQEAKFAAMWQHNRERNRISYDKYT